MPTDAALAQEALLRAICADPSDDLPRMAYADWLEDDGQPERAEFCRTQIALANWPCECDEVERVYHPECRCKEKGELQRRERDILRHAHWDIGGGYHVALTAGYSAPDRPLYKLFPPGGGVELANVEWLRGFISSISLTLADYMRPGLAAALFAAAPIEAVRLTCRRTGTSFDAARSCGWYDAARRAAGSLPEADDLPHELWDALEGEKIGNMGWCWYPTLALAQSALSTAAVALGRHSAGLPPLEAPP